ncbi:E3 ubiquitin-protein ligase TRIM71-like [Ostrea edulis]|uniref:E3 ubiquitin-protein ligase TRIM71-like n=1 Tax=Ostrea edulis TaxID=37623 RepID=UPI002094BCAF|nr:E3 ubiquitin-protein ligase TRIM71-like [Ostrea edulis]
MFADVQITRTKEEKVLRLVEPLVVNIVPTGLSSVRHVSCVDSETTWLCGNGPQLKLMDRRGKELKTTKTPKQYSISGMSMSISGDLVFCSTADRSVYKMKDIKHIEYLFSTGDFEPCGLHCCRNGDILVSVYNNQRAKVDKFGSKGYKTQDIEIKENGRRLFKKPTFITQNKTGDICVSDQDRVVVTTDCGTFRFNYYGRKFKTFTPRGICCNKLSHIIVADNINNVIHVVNENGTMLSALDTSGQGILGRLYSPSSLSLDESDNIWVGEMFSGLIKVLKHLELCYV